MMLRQLLLIAVLSTSFVARTAAQQTATPHSSRSSAAGDLAGMYSFLREGEFVQLTIEDGQLSGFISRFGDTPSDKGQFINQFFDKTTLEGEHLSFKTKTVHGVWYEFAGDAATAPGKQPNQEGYRVLKGTLTQHAADAQGKEKDMERKVEFKSFPADLGR